MKINYLKTQKVLTAEKLLWVLLLYQQPHNPRLQITACLSLPARDLSFASPQGSSLGCSQSNPVLCSQPGCGAAEPHLFGGYWEGGAPAAEGVLWVEKLLPVNGWQEEISINS